MNFSAAPRSGSLHIDNRSGTTEVRVIKGFSKYHHATGDAYVSGEFLSEPEPLLKVRVRSSDINVIVGRRPSIGDVLICVFTPHHRFNVPVTKFYIVDSNDKSWELTAKQVRAHLRGEGLPPGYDVPKIEHSCNGGFCIHCASQRHMQK